jgi:hypothetical protein
MMVQAISKQLRSRLPPEVKLLKNGGDIVFYGDTWGYIVRCDVTND